MQNTYAPFFHKGTKKGEINVADFMVRFLICNVFISGIIGILLTVRRILKNTLSGRMQYHLWFLLLGLLAVPFIPFRLIGFPQILSWFGSLRTFPASDTGIVMKESAGMTPVKNAGWLNDFALSVNSKTPSIAGYLLAGIWMAGILAMIILVVISSHRLRTLKKSALPLQNPEVRRLYKQCLEELKIRRDIPVYSTAFLKSPIIAGFFKPCIYLPIHLISDFNESEIRYILLHELHHYKSKDAFANYLIILAGVIYWFNPLVWYALKEMRSDREIACDASVLRMLGEDAYADYGNALINFAQKVSLTPVPFAAGFGDNRKQMKKRIIHIASYEKPTFIGRLKGMTAFMLTALLLLWLAPFLSTYAADENRCQWDSFSENISYIDLSSYFGEYEGSFVLYDQTKDAWSIHNREHATLRVAPDSTYKIYDALFGLEEGIITPEDSFLAWNGKTYPFEAWNTDQTLPSAMHASVNWYFEFLDKQLGAADISDYIQKIQYGNENISGGFPAYWMESSLKISPIEQVELLIRLQNNRFGFAPENINAVKDAICLSASDDGTLYGKTGTGRVDGQDINGWFVGFVEAADHTYFFAANIGAEGDADGNTVAEITMSVLSDMNIWK